MGCLDVSCPSFLWVAASLAIGAVLTVQGPGLLLLTNLLIYFEIQKPRSTTPRSADGCAIGCAWLPDKARCNSSSLSSCRGWRPAPEYLLLPLDHVKIGQWSVIRKKCRNCVAVIDRGYALLGTGQSGHTASHSEV